MSRRSAQATIDALLDWGSKLLAEIARLRLENTRLRLALQVHIPEPASFAKIKDAS